MRRTVCRRRRDCVRLRACVSSACVSCALANEDERQTLEWKAQCDGCETTMGRRRLLASSSSIISMTVSGCSSQELAAYFALSHLVSLPSSGNQSTSYLRQVSTLVYEIQIPTTNPQQKMRQLQQLIRTNFSCDIVTQPRLLLRIAPTSSAFLLGPSVFLTFLSSCIYIKFFFY
jgi:hypothetical protein